MKKTHGRALAALLMSGLILLAAIPPLPASAAAKLDVDLTQQGAAEPEDLPGDGVEVEIVRPEAAQPEAARKRVLIYHSHTCEAYEPDYEG